MVPNKIIKCTQRQVLQTWLTRNTLKSREPEVLIVAGRDGQPMPPDDLRDVAVFDRHTLAGLLEHRS